MGDLVELQTFSVQGNQLSEIPPSLGNCHKLRVLNLSQNRLTFLPLELSKLSQLETLAVDSNRFDCFPPVIAHLSNLRSISMLYNPLVVELPRDLTSILPALSELKVEIGKQFDIPRDVAQEGGQQVLRYVTSFAKLSNCIQFDEKSHWVPDDQAPRYRFIYIYSLCICLFVLDSHFHQLTPPPQKKNTK